MRRVLNCILFASVLLAFIGCGDLDPKYLPWEVPEDKTTDQSIPKQYGYMKFEYSIPDTIFTNLNSSQYLDFARVMLSCLTYFPNVNQHHFVNTFFWFPDVARVPIGSYDVVLEGTKYDATYVFPHKICTYRWETEDVKVTTNDTSVVEIKDNCSYYRYYNSFE